MRVVLIQTDTEAKVKSVVQHQAWGEQVTLPEDSPLGGWFVSIIKKEKMLREIKRVSVRPALPATCAPQRNTPDP